MAQAHLRSLYRSILRELPARPPSAPPSSVQVSIRKHIAAAEGNTSPEYNLARRQEMEQFVQYLKAQRMYGTLLERYNPGISMEEEERVRLTARRVGMDLPILHNTEKK